MTDLHAIQEKPDEENEDDSKVDEKEVKADKDELSVIGGVSKKKTKKMKKKQAKNK